MRWVAIDAGGDRSAPCPTAVARPAGMHNPRRIVTHQGDNLSSDVQYHCGLGKEVARLSGNERRLAPARTSIARSNHENRPIFGNIVQRQKQLSVGELQNSSHPVTAMKGAGVDLRSLGEARPAVGARMHPAVAVTARPWREGGR